MTLVNVRLNAAQEAKVRALRERGVQLSQLLRKAIDAEYEQQVNKAMKPSDIDAILHEIYAKYPDPPDMPPRGYDLRDRKAVREAIARQLRSKGRKT